MASPRMTRLGKGVTTASLQFGPVVRGALWALVVSLIVFVVFAFLLTYTSIPERTVPITSFLTSLCAVFIGGYRAARRAHCKGWLHGMLTSLIYYLAVVVVGVSIFDKGMDISIVWSYFPLLLAGTVGGVIGVR